MGELLAEKARVAEEEAALLGKKASDAEEEIKRLRLCVSKVQGRPFLQLAGKYKCHVVSCLFFLRPSQTIEQSPIVTQYFWHIRTNLNTEMFLSIVRRRANRYWKKSSWSRWRKTETSHARGRSQVRLTWLTTFPDGAIIKSVSRVIEWDLSTLKVTKDVKSRGIVSLQVLWSFCFPVERGKLWCWEKI